MQLKQENNQLQNKINSFQNLQNIYNDLLNENNQLKQQIFQLNNQIINSNSFTNKFQNFNNLSNTQNTTIDILAKLLKDKEDIINDLNEKLKRFPFILEKNEKLMSVIFSSFNQKINYSIVCKNTDSIHELEEVLYKECPDLFKAQNFIFLFKGEKINKLQTLDENKIKNGDTIILNSNE